MLTGIFAVLGLNVVKMQRSGTSELCGGGVSFSIHVHTIDISRHSALNDSTPTSSLRAVILCIARLHVALSCRYTETVKFKIQNFCRY